MTEFDIGKIVFLCVAGFIGTFVDSIAGGGGLITVPAYLFAGFGPHETLGTNKFSATFGSLSSSISFFKNGKIFFPLIKYILPATFLGSVLGVRAVLSLSQEFLYPLVSIMILIVGLYTYFKKDLGMKNTFIFNGRNHIIMGMIFAFIMGFYDGFFGPGTGSFLLFIFIKFFGMDFVNASGNTRILNFTSNISSLLMFLVSGSVNYIYGIIVGLFCMFGAIAGTKIAISRGASFVKPIFLIMSFAVFIRLLLMMFK